MVAGTKAAGDLQSSIESETQDTILPDRQGFPMDNELYDSDQEVPSRHKGKDTAPERSRRVTIGAEEGSDAIHLTHEDGHTILGKIETPEQFLTSAQEHPEEWAVGVKNLISNYLSLQEDNQELSRQNEQLGFDIVQEKSARKRNNAAQKLMQQEIDQLRSDAERLRQLRDQWRTRQLDTEQKRQVLETELLLLRSISDQSSRHQGPVDSDDEEAIHRATPASHRVVTASHRATPATTTASTKEGQNKKYPDVPNFRGEDDREDWDQWRMHLETKFRQSSILFGSEQDKIDYIRDHCKGTAFNVIKARANPKYEKAYTTADEAVQDLENMFGEYDKEAKAEAQLHDTKFKMGGTNKNESFDEFLARFTSVVTLLDLTDTQIISNLKRCLNDRIRYKVLDGTSYTTSKQLIKRCRQCDLDIQTSDSLSTKRAPKTVNQSTKSTSGTSTSNAEASKPRKSRGVMHPAHVMDKLFKENRCFKCLKAGHQAKDDNAPCKNDTYFTPAQVAVQLKAIGVEPDVAELDTSGN